MTEVVSPCTRPRAKKEGRSANTDDNARKMEMEIEESRSSDVSSISSKFKVNSMHGAKHNVSKIPLFQIAVLVPPKK